MHRRPLNTEKLRSAGYDPRDKRLELEFRSGEVRAYRAVPEEVADRFFSSPSPEAYWEDRIAEEYPYDRSPGTTSTDARAKLEALFGKPD